MHKVVHAFAFAALPLAVGFLFSVSARDQVVPKELLPPAS
jgi:hypothetical protein